MAYGDRPLLDQLAATTQELATIANLPNPATSSTAPGMQVLSVDQRVQLVMGQNYPHLSDGQQWPMSCNALYHALQGVVSAFMIIQVQMATLSAELGSKYASLEPRMALAEANVAAALLATAANAAAGALAEQHAQTALSKATLLEAQVAKDGQAIAAAQARLDQDERALATAQTTASNALATAQAAQSTQAALAARFRTARVASPLLPLGQSATVSVTWSTPFVDDKYVVVAECEGTALLGLVAVPTARTATGCTVQIKNSLGLNLALGAGTISLLATHD